MSNLKTKLHSYHFDISTLDEKAAYQALCAKLEAIGLRCFETIASNHFRTGETVGPEVELETKHLFNNQWNGTSHRLFDWAQDILHYNHSIKQGYWLEQTAEMREVRRNTVGCRYCGKQEPAQKGYVFCPHCIDSEYLKASDLPLTRMKAIDDTSECGPLTEAEKAHLMPLYKEAQLHGSTARGKARIKSEREKLEAKYKKAIHAAQTEHDGFLWLMDHGINTSNVIYYSHTDTFCFGWRQPLGPEVLSEWLNIASEFPFTYEIKQNISY